MTEKWIRDTGLVFSLLFLLLGAYGNTLFLWLCGFFLIALVFYPSALKPVAFLWLKIADLLGSVMNRVFFGLIFFTVITSIGYLRRMLVGDQRYESHNNKDSTAFVTRDQMIDPMDMERPY